MAGRGGWFGWRALEKAGSQQAESNSSDQLPVACLDAQSLQHVPVPACACRLPMLDVCSSWCGALLAAPALVPTAVLTGVNVSALLQQAATLRLRITQLRLEDLGVRVRGVEGHPIPDWHLA